VYDFNHLFLLEHIEIFQLVMALNSLFFVGIPLSNNSLTHDCTALAGVWLRIRESDHCMNHVLVNHLPLYLFASINLVYSLTASHIWLTLLPMFVSSKEQLLHEDVMKRKLPASRKSLKFDANESVCDLSTHSYTGLLPAKGRLHETLFDATVTENIQNFVKFSVW